MSLHRPGEDTQPTEDDEVVDQLRRAGVLGPFRVSGWAARSHTGLVRTHNEDRWRERDNRLFVLADGMGGHDGGDVAAEVAVDEAVLACTELTDVSAPDTVARINRAVVDAGERDGFDRLGTTLVVLVTYENRAVVLNVGDSRAYRLRHGELEQLTEDHTVRNELAQAGVPLERVRESNLRLNALTTHIGRRSDDPIPYHVASYSLQAGDRYLLCSDGIHGLIGAPAIVDALDGGTCEASAEQLIDRALRAGGRDNATAMVIDVERSAEARPA